MTQPPHFIQAGDEPALIGDGSDNLLCACGQVLARNMRPGSLLAIDILCGKCGTVTSVPGLPDRVMPPQAVTVVERRTEPAPAPIQVPAPTVLISHEESERLTSLYRPREPESNVHVISPETLDAVVADYDRLSDGRLAMDLSALSAAGGNATVGLRDYPLAWALAHLRDSVRKPGWDFTGSSEDMLASCMIAGFRHFIGCWSGHPLFPALANTASEQRFSFHALALAGVAKTLSDSGNRTGFAVNESGGTRVTGLYIGTGPGSGLAVSVVPFDQFAWPYGRQWDQISLRHEVGEAMAASQGRLNLRHPGMLVLSLGTARTGIEQPLVDAIQQALRVQGKRHRGLSAICITLPKFARGRQPNELIFGNAFYPIVNRSYAGRDAIQVSEPTNVTGAN